MKSRLVFATALALVAACDRLPTAVTSGDSDIPASVSNAGSQAGSTSSVRWNRKAIALFRARGGNPGRALAYLSLAQYRAALAADSARHGQDRPSPAGAVAAASRIVLKQFYPLDAASIDAEIVAQRDEAPFGSEHNRNFTAGETLGEAVAAAVLAFAASDNFGLTSPGTPPLGDGYWTSNGGPIVRGGLGARPFFLLTGSELRLPPPPSYTSAEFASALAEVRALSDNRTTDQVANTLFWVPFSAVVFNDIMAGLIDRYHRTELEAARILGYANTAAFDAIIACFDTKYTYWLIRPSQADVGITLATGLPNHPSYPSAHSCETGAFEGVLADAFPAERDYLARVAEDANMSRIIGGLHYRFDGDGGLVIGRGAAQLALSRRSID
jgi:hypothetical protein